MIIFKLTYHFEFDAVQIRPLRGLIATGENVYYRFMKSVSIIVPENSVLSAITGPNYLFNAVNLFLQDSGKDPLFKVKLVGLSKEVKLDGGLFSVHSDSLLFDAIKTDLIIIPALSGDMESAIKINREFIPWIIDRHKNGAEVASLCVGAFLLASSGLLDGKKCSTHWILADKFRQMFPDVELVDGTIITEESGIYSSGGANSYWNLLLYLVEKYSDRDTAIQTAKYFAIDIDRASQSPFILFQGQKDHRDEEIKRAQTFIEENYEEKFTVQQLAEMVAINRRSLERRFQKATNNSIIEYAQRVRVEAAKREFESSLKNVTEVMFDVGYSDTKAFRTVFKKITGLTPIEYRSKYNDSAVSI